MAGEEMKRGGRPSRSLLMIRVRSTLVLVQGYHVGANAGPEMQPTKAKQPLSSSTQSFHRVLVFADRCQWT